MQMDVESDISSCCQYPHHIFLHCFIECNKVNVTSKLAVAMYICHVFFDIFSQMFNVWFPLLSFRLPFPHEAVLFYVYNEMRFCCL